MKILNALQGAQDWHSIAEIVKPEFNSLGVHRFHYNYMPMESRLNVDLMRQYFFGFDDIMDYADLVLEHVYSRKSKMNFYAHTRDTFEPTFAPMPTLVGFLNLSDEASRSLFSPNLNLYGIVIPAFGPQQNLGMFCLATDEGQGPAGKTHVLQNICQQIHLRICKIEHAKLAPATNFTGREKEVINWLITGKTNKEIAAEMTLSPYTVDAYLRRVFLKLGVSSRVEAALKASNLDLRTANT